MFLERPLKTLFTLAALAPHIGARKQFGTDVAALGPPYDKVVGIIEAVGNDRQREFAPWL